jgi:hypothetical protein
MSQHRLLPGSASVVGGVTVNPLAAVPWVGQWKFNGDGQDSIGINHLTGTGTPTFTAGKLGGAAGATNLVAASNQYWTVADNADLRTGNVNFMACAWVYLASKPANPGIVGKNYSEEWRVDYNATPDRYRFEIRNSSNVYVVLNADSFGSPPLNEWHLIVAWHNAVEDTLNICVNNGAIDSITTGGVFPSSGTAPLIIGSIIDSAGRFNGRIDCVGFAKGLGSIPTQAILDALWNGGAGTENFI